MERRRKRLEAKKVCKCCGRTLCRRKGKPLARGKAPSSSKPLPPSNAKRKAKRKAEKKVYGPGWKWISQNLPCAALGHPDHRCIGARCPAHHLETVGSGGQDEENCVPACVQLHTEMHQSEDRVETRYGLDLKAIAVEAWAKYREEAG